MSFTEYVMASGDWALSLEPETPRAVLRAVDLATIGFSQLVVTSGQVDSAALSDDTMLGLARYVGIYRRRSQTGFELGGRGLPVLLGEQDGKSDIIESEKSTVNGWLSQWFSIMVPTALDPGMLDSPGGEYTGKFRYVNYRTAWNELATAFGVEWRINNRFQLDVGRVANLYGATPRAVIMGESARMEGGRDLNLIGFTGGADLSEDLEQHAVRVVYLTGAAENPVLTTVGPTGSPQFTDPKGAPLPLDVLIEAYNDTSTNPSSLATAHLGRYAGLRYEWSINGSGAYDIGLDCPVGSPIWLYDPDAGLTDVANAVPFRGSQIYPVASRLMGLTTPITAQHGVYLRRKVGSAPASYVDLTPYVQPETGEQKVTLGAVPRPSR